MNEHAFLTAGVENLTDRTYQEYLDFRPLSPNATADRFRLLRPGVTFYFGGHATY